MKGIRTYGFAVAVLVALMAPASLLYSQSADNQKVRLSYGIEWGAGLSIFSWQDCTYVTDDQYLVIKSNNDYDIHANGQAAARIGIETGKVGISMLAGYQGFGRDLRGFPIYGRVSYFFKGCDSRGMYIFTDGGMAIPEKKNDRTVFFGDAGAGYRIPVCGRFSMNIGLSLMMSSSHPGSVYDPYSSKYVSGEKLRKNNLLLSSARVIISLDM